MGFEKYLAVIDEKKDIFTGVSDSIWGFAELSLLEFQSAELYCKVLADNGFTVEKDVADIKTCFKGIYGHGKPVIGILAEFDALSGLSQKAACPERDELVPGGSGHGCGHNMLGAGSLAAAFAVKEYLADKGGEGTVIFYGCPGEEGGASKAFMAREGIWKELDAAITWHPGDVNAVTSGSNNACIQKEYKFTGIASHAAGAPQFGRSALDAVQLMNMGVEFLREHMEDAARIHYAITDAGGNSPNVVQPHAQVLYMVRSPRVRQANALQKRVDTIAQAAAMMTETTLTVRFIDGCSDTLPNETLEKQLWKSFQAVGVPTGYAPEDWALAAALKKSCAGLSKNELPGVIPETTAEDKVYLAEKSEKGTRAINDFLVPYHHSTYVSPGSTDVGDVSWLVPTAQIRTACFAAGSPGHSWQNVSAGCSGIGHTGLLGAGKVMAHTVMTLFEQPEIIKAAKEEWDAASTEGYDCPVPPDAVAIPVGDKM